VVACGLNIYLFNDDRLSFSHFVLLKIFRQN